MKIFFVFVFIFTISNAHKLNVFTDFENNKLFVSTYFANGNACKNCSVKIIKDNNIIIESKTNNNGEYEVLVNENRFKISVDAGSGHIVSKDIENEITIKNEISNKKIKSLEDENKKLKLKIALLEDKLALMDIFKMILALVCIAGIFMFLKRVKK